MSNEKRKLYLFTDYFPFTENKESFLEAEIPYLCKNFNLTIVTCDTVSTTMRTLPSEVEVIRFHPHDKKFSTTYKITKTLSYIFSVGGICEIFDILKSKTNVKNRLVDSLYFYWTAKRIYKQLKNKGVYNRKEGAIYYFYWNNFMPLSYALHRKKIKGSKAISRAHNYDLYNSRMYWGRQPYKSYMAKRLNKMVFICQMGKDYFLQTYGEKFNNKTLVSYLGTTDGGICKAQSDNSFNVVSCSYVSPIKRVELIVESLQNCNFVTSYTHFGGGEGYENLVELCNKKLQGKMQYNLCGMQSNSQIKQNYKNGGYNLFITCSKMEGLPVSIMEALSFGIPIIATNVGGNSELIGGTDNILLPENPTVEQIVNAITQIKNYSNERLQSLRESNRKIWQEKFSAETNYNNFVKVLKSL